MKGEKPELRDAHGPKKSGKKMAESSPLTAQIPGYFTPLRFHRRQLHVENPTTGGVRRAYGGTRSLGFKRGSLVKHVKYGLAYVGGFSKDRLSLHAVADGRRLGQNFRPDDCSFLTYSSWRTRLLPA
jgi:hypothetical protein